jgi:acetyl-CoA carboxylase, biotin carboxylase subunit
MRQDFELASSEALRAFADGALYLEKYIAQPRHVEIQVLADKRGNAIYLGERECSLQRRHQKIIEECPSPIVNPEMRRRMGEAALGVVRAARYENAGTVEFLVDEERNFYFLEMNTRLQVEHPVTEAVYGIDIVREQFCIASGEALSLNQEGVLPRGWALECRIYAEDTENNFFPSPGLIAKLVEPSGPGVRLDSGVYEGWQVPIHYDPLIAKLTVAGANRAETIERMRRALSEYRVEGIKTNLSFLLELVNDPEFQKGNLSTEFIPEFLNRRMTVASAPPIDPRAYAVAAVLSHCDRLRESRLSTGAASQGGDWKYSARPRRHQW